MVKHSKHILFSKMLHGGIKFTLKSSFVGPPLLHNSKDRAVLLEESFREITRSIRWAPIVVYYQHATLYYTVLP